MCALALLMGGTASHMVEAEGEYIDTTSVGGDTAKASHDYLFIKQTIKFVTWKVKRCYRIKYFT
jgi:hypothetical protein